MPTASVLAWAQAFGIGSIAGVVLSVWLTRLGQRRQFRWQLTAQRVEAALVSYTECYKIAARMRDELHRNPGETLRDTWSTVHRQRLVHLSEQLEDREIELRARGADMVADVFADVRTAAGMFLGIAVAVDEIDDHRDRQISDLHARTMQELHELVEVVPDRWVEWESNQLPRRWRPTPHFKSGNGL